MMKSILVLILTAVSVYGQTFKICEEKKTDKTLTEVNGAYLIRMVYGPSAEASSLKKSLSYVPTNQHPVIYATHTAFADHRRLVLSPDIVWLMISQGFATHIRINAEEFRKDLVNFKGKKELEVRRDGFRLGSPDNDWSGVIDEFSSKIKTNKNLEEIIIGDFSTTDAIALTAYQLAHMDSVSKYFDYSMSTLCGIPEITLEGTTEDWEKILKNVELLKDYKLGKWVNGLKPILQQFVNASKGEVNKDFWQSIYKIHEESGGPYITGWLLNFFPYTDKGKVREIIQFDKDMKMSEVKKSHYDTTFPKGQSKVPFIWKYFSKNINMELNGGFLGVIQNKADMSVKANIAWAVARKNGIKIAKGKIPGWMETSIRITPEKALNLKNFPSVKSLSAHINSDNDLKDVRQLKMLQYIHVKGSFEGAFLKLLQNNPNLQYIDCDWKIKAQYLPLLSKLKLRRISFHHNFNHQVLKHLPKNIKHINFREIQLTAEHSKDLKPYKNLESFYLSNCKIDAGFLKGLIDLNIKSVSIYECELPTNFETSINSFSSLQILSIRKCGLTNSLKLTAPLLEIIDLEGNKLKEMRISGQTNLKEIEINKNELQVLEVSSLSVEKINADNNDLKTFTFKTPNLMHLSLDENQIISLPNLQNTKLETLQLDENPLTSLEIPYTLQKINLSGITLNKNIKTAISKTLKLNDVTLFSCGISDEDGWVFKNLIELKELRLSKKSLTDKASPWLKTLKDRGVDLKVW